MNTPYPIKALQPWLKNRGRKGPIDGIVLHHTGGSTLAGAVTTLRQHGYGYHYLIDKDGTVYKGCPVLRRCSHAGYGKWHDGRNPNDATIGISLVGGLGKPFTEDQVESAFMLIVGELLPVFDSIKYISTHRLIDKRKIDPSPFGFKDFAYRTGLTTWRDESLGREWDS